jgi:membrane protein implicated in regulation of membrane protease activity
VFVVIAGRIAMRARVAPSSTTGPGLLVGRQATVRLGSAGAQVFIQGAWWGIRPAERQEIVADGSRVEVVGMDGLTLVVDALPATDGGIETDLVAESEVVGEQPEVPGGRP